MKKLPLLLALSFMVAGCTKRNDTAVSKPCSPLICTEIFASVNVKILDKHGNAVKVKNFKSVNTRTGKRLTPSNADSPYVNSIYIVASDSNLGELSEEGDVITVSATNQDTNETITANFKIAGGCVCHVGKISGPDQIAFTR